MQNFRSIDPCRICGHAQLIPLLHPREKALSSVFPRQKDQPLTIGPLALVKSQDDSHTFGLVELCHPDDTDWGRNLTPFVALLVG